jgi:hypothetical protein
MGYPCPPRGENDMEFTFNYVVEEREGAFVATCLEMGLVATADKREDLPAIMEKLITRQVVFAIENENFQDLFHPADPAVWQRFQEAYLQEKAKEIRKTKEMISTPVSTST